MLWASGQVRGTRFGASRPPGGPAARKHDAPGRGARGRRSESSAYLPCIILPLFGFSGRGGRLAGVL